MEKLIKTFDKNKSQQVHINLQEYKGHDLVDARIYYKDKEGDYQRTGKGLAMNVGKLPELIEALQLAELEAKAAGLIGDKVIQTTSSDGQIKHEALGSTNGCLTEREQNLTGVNFQAGPDECGQVLEQ